MKQAVVSKDCVACGVCIRVCPFEAVSSHYGVRAVVDRSICVGCGKCKKDCPAGLISIEEVVDNENENT